MKRTLLPALLLLLSSATASAQIHRVAQMNTDQIRALDKQKTVVILPGGVLEEHGPHLPSFSDGYSNEWEAQKLADAIVERPGWAVLVFPTMPFGHAGANVIGDKYVFPGTYGIRPSTLRAVFMDLATELGEQGFRWVFVVNYHGSPFHNQMLDQAGDYFRDVYGGRMVNFSGLTPKPEHLTAVTRSNPRTSAAEDKENGLADFHAGMTSTSVQLFLHADLVNPIYRTLPAFAGNTPADLTQIARRPDWLGYFGSPRLATATYGAQSMQYRAARDIALAIAILDGLDERDIPRRASVLDDQNTASQFEGLIKYEAEVERKQLEWMKKKGIQ